MYLALVLLGINLLLMSGGEDLVRPYVVELSLAISSLYTIMLFALSLNLIAAVIAIPLGTMFARSM